jgi:hypothetical protein
MHAGDDLDGVVDGGKEHCTGKAVQHRPPKPHTNPREPLRRGLDVRQPTAEDLQELLTQSCACPSYQCAARSMSSAARGRTMRRIDVDGGRC